ncbi:MerR family transcriptional regulator [Vallitalea guaymasensis]|uniref:MerR family transcriptional regulator n=1 Tax=Vallitalea guaymasensis TaxID=1185412 RepID=A0A8J8SB25_9FIRM|nr:MerR family transcriptional regulator [Vallitalea guaymasensis]QUH27911.1 MerR family transcriptional regulator [Vallitalea guaymasensis]
MRIGMFAKLNNQSIDTIRYYIGLNLIHPFRKGRYYYFGKEQQKELDELLYLKKMRFTLQEIKKITLIKQLNKIKTVTKSNYIKDILLQKRESIELEINDLNRIIQALDDEIKTIDEKQNINLKQKGVAFKNLEYICCPKCGKPIEISKGVLKNNSIYEGLSVCDCGYSISIREGIIITKHDDDNIIEPFIKYNNPIDTTINDLPQSYIDFMMSSTKEIVQILIEKNLSDKILCFMKSGLGLLEINLLERTQNIKLMMLIDDDFNKLKIAKTSIESKFPNANIIYVCSELFDLPFKKKSVDIGIDFYASFVNGFRWEYNIYEYIIPILKDRSSIIGLYLYFKSFNMLTRLDCARRKLFDSITISDIIEGNNYKQNKIYDETILLEGENINGFFIEGDKVNSRIMVFERD